VIESFVDSWALFHEVYLAGWLIAALLALVGVVVVARDQIFLGAAIAQTSMLGITVGIRFGGALLGGAASGRAADLLHTAFGGAFAVGGAMLVATDDGRRGESREALIGWLFLAGASLSVLTVAHSPHGLAEVQRLLASTIIGAARADVVLFASMLAVSIATASRYRDTLVLLVTDAEMARAVGVRVDTWNRILAVWLGLAIAVAIHVAGLAYTFGCLVLPALAAKHLCREVRYMLLAAPAIATAVTIVAFVVANHHDYPPGQLAVAMLAAVVAAAWMSRRARS